MVNMIDDELWNPEPTLRPEDEIILRKLHEMLQTTADDLKLLSGELSKFHEPGVQIKSAPTPLDEEFNEKVHIEEVVNAKFHGYKIIETLRVPESNRNNVAAGTKNINNTQRPKIINTCTQVNTTSTKRPVINRNLGISRTRIVQIDDNSQDSCRNEKLNNGRVYKAPTVAYNEFCYKHIEPKPVETSRNELQVQHMPRISIRSELKEQKVLQMDIVPVNDNVKNINMAKSNVSVVSIQHEYELARNTPIELINHGGTTQIKTNKIIRKVSKMSVCDSSGSTNNTSSDALAKLDTQKRILTSIRNSPKNSARSRNKKNTSTKIEQSLEKRPGLNLDQWKKKLSLVYGSSSSKRLKSSPPITVTRSRSPKRVSKPKTFNNAEYIPYSRLTIGGARASDIEREISDLPNKNDIPLSPILDKILSSRENSFHKESPRRNRLKSSPRILTTSDENLLQEVIDIERSVSETLSKNIKINIYEPVTKSQNVSSESNNDKENGSYADDFEDDKSDHSGKSGNPRSADNSEVIADNNNSIKSNQSDIDEAFSNDDDNDDAISKPGPSNTNISYAKPNLSYKDSVDIFEFIHSVDMQDIATQSNTSNKISPKETQTTPRADRPSVPPTIHNDLWPTVDPKREVEKMFEMEKDFIKKLIIDEYGDLLEKNISKPTTSNEHTEDSRKNESALQKNTQTSPAHVKSIMTSPKRTKTRTTSPFHLSVPVVHQPTSPLVFVTDEEQRIDIVGETDDISVNLSSPRFSLRLPQNSREVFSNLEGHSRTSSKTSAKTKLNNRTVRKTSVSSTSVDADNSSSELSSLGEVKMKRLRKRVPTTSESSSMSKYSSDFQSLGILPLRSEGEVSLGQIATNRANKYKLRHSEGETSFNP